MNKKEQKRKEIPKTEQPKNQSTDIKRNGLRVVARPLQILARAIEACGHCQEARAQAEAEASQKQQSGPTIQSKTSRTGRGGATQIIVWLYTPTHTPVYTPAQQTSRERSEKNDNEQRESKLERK